MNNSGGGGGGSAVVPTATTSPATYSPSTFNIGGLPSPYLATPIAIDTNAPPPAPSPTSATGGVTPACGCNSSVTTNYGSAGAQAGALGDMVNSIFQLIPPVQNLATPIPVRATTPQASPTPSSVWGYPGIKIADPHWISDLINQKINNINNAFIFGASALTTG
jgi:hypothetical protein